MCGMVGFIGTPSDDHINAFEDMFKMDVIRGEDSCGITLVYPNKDKPLVIKDIMLPNDLLTDNRYCIAKRKHNIKAMMGHNRWATVGRVVKANAHPFQVGPITLTHNGTLSGLWRLPSKVKTDTDSELLADSIAEAGIEDTWKNMDGAAALAFYNSESKTFHLISNGQRPLHFALTDDRKAMFYSSEAGILRLAVGRRGIHLFEDKVWKVGDHILYTFQFDGKEVTFVSETLEHYVEKFHFHRSAYDWPEFTSDQEDFSEWDPSFQHTGPVLAVDNDKKPVVMGPKTTYTRAPADPYKAVNITRKLLSEDKFREKFKNCMCCGQSVYDDYDESVIYDYDNGEIICSDCVSTAKRHGMMAAILNKGVK